MALVFVAHRWSPEIHVREWVKNQDGYLIPLREQDAWVRRHDSDTLPSIPQFASLSSQLMERTASTARSGEGLPDEALGPQMELRALPDAGVTES